MFTAFRRRLLGASALAVLAFAVSHSTQAAAVPEESYPKAVEADIAHLEALLELNKTKKGIPGRIKSTSILIASYAQENLKGKDAAKMAALRAAALKVADAAQKKDNDGMAKAVAALKGVTADANADKKPLKLASMNKLELHEVMDLFGSGTGGGMFIEKDLRAMKKDGVKDTKAAEILATRTAAIADLSLDLPPEFGGKKKKEDWDRWNKDMKEQASDLASEAAKGTKADAAKMKAIASKLEGSCQNCHNVFRDP